MRFLVCQSTMRVLLGVRCRNPRPLLPLRVALHLKADLVGGDRHGVPTEQGGQLLRLQPASGQSRTTAWPSSMTISLALTFALTPFRRTKWRRASTCLAAALCGSQNPAPYWAMGTASLSRMYSQNGDSDFVSISSGVTP